MEWYLLFDAGCAVCNRLAKAIEEAAGGKLEAVSIRDPRARAWLDRAYPDGWEHQPYLVAVEGGRVQASSGLGMALRLGWLLGPGKAWHIWNLARRYGVVLRPGEEFSAERRGFLKRATLFMAGLFFFPRFGTSSGQGWAKGYDPTESNVVTPLPPDVEEFIQGTYLSHAVALPDPNETVETLRLYLESRGLLKEGRVEEALQILFGAVERHFDSRYAHAGLGSALLQRYERTGRMEDLRMAMQELIHAADIGMHYGKVRYTWLVAQGLARLQEAVAMDQFFQRALAVQDQIYQTYLHYAQGLHLLGDSRAEQWYQGALQLQPEGNIDAAAHYAEWLLDRGRDEDVLRLLSPHEHVEYLHFLRGVALERLRRLNEARVEYEQYVRFSADFPAPDKYRIPGSPAQQGITFRGDVGTLSHCHAHSELSGTIACEAGGESQGGMRMVGWTVRTRVFKGTVGCCISIDNSGATLCDQYESVLHQPNQFVNQGEPGCCCAPSPTTDHVAYDVWYGWAPDPMTSYCACGAPDGLDPCSAAVHCTCSGQYGTDPAGPMSFRGTCVGCACPNIGDCFHSHGQLCGDGNSPENCFYNIHCPNNNCC